MEMVLNIEYAVEMNGIQITGSCTSLNSSPNVFGLMESVQCKKGPVIKRQRNDGDPERNQRGIDSHLQVNHDEVVSQLRDLLRLGELGLQRFLER